jgi:hypothetical protein
MGAVAFGVSRAVAGHHQMEVGAVNADVAQQMVIELQEVGVGATLFRTAEKRREDVHFVVLGLGVAVAVTAPDAAAYAPRSMNPS